jgi:aryl-alcohol dehydrogenase-like predicted oxidoreductase
MMISALKELEGLDYVMFPYNFIHARADYSEFLPTAISKQIGLIAIKPLAAGSIVKLDPKARRESKPENEQIQLYRERNRTLMPAVVKKLTQSLNRLPNETLCQAALRFVCSRSFITSTMPGMFQSHELEENCEAIRNQLEMSGNERVALDAARHASLAYGPSWLPEPYRWLDERWRA